MKYITWTFFLFLVVGCGQSQTVQDVPDKSQGSENPTPSCPSYEIDGQTLEEVPEKELDQYELAVEDRPEGMDAEQQKESSIRRQRRDDFRHYLEEEGMSREELQEIGGIIVKNTSVVVQIKEGISEEKRTPVDNAVKQIRDKYNEQAIIVDEMPISYKEKNERVTEVMNTLSEHETISKKLTVGGSCRGGSLDIQVTLLEELEGEEVDFFRSAFDFPVYTKVSASETSGYVTAIDEERMLVDFTWFSSAPEEAEVGHYVTITHGPILTSFPGKSSAFKTDVQEPLQPDGADTTDRGAVREALSSVDESRLDVTEASFDKEKDEWNVTITDGMGDEEKEETITVPD